MDAFKTLSILILFFGTAFSQETGVVTIRTKVVVGQKTTMSQGCGVIIKIHPNTKCETEGYEGWVLADVLTAEHVLSPPGDVVPDSTESLVIFSGEKKARLNVLKRGEIVRTDIAFGTSWVPPSSKELPVAEGYVDGEVEVFGRAGIISVNDPPRRLFGRRIGLGVEDGRQYFDIMVAPGDSGGPILFQGKVVGIVSGGITQQPWGESWSTWPLISARFEKIKEIIKR